MKDLTIKQAATLHFIIDYIEGNHFPPTIAEIAEAFGVQPNAAQNHVEALVKKGAITRRVGAARSIAVTVNHD